MTSLPSAPWAATAPRDDYAALRGLDLPVGGYAVFGSGPLAVRGLIHDARDVDVICRGRAWERVQALGPLARLPRYRVEVVRWPGTRISFGTRWGIGNPDVHDLIEQADMIGGLPFVALAHVVAYKIVRRTSRDLDHLAAVRANGLGHMIAAASTLL